MATDLQVSVTEATDDQSATLPGVEAMREEADSWRVEWVDGTSRETPLAGSAWYAREFEEEGNVMLLTDDEQRRSRRIETHSAMCKSRGRPVGAAVTTPLKLGWGRVPE